MKTAHPKQATQQKLMKVKEEIASLEKREKECFDFWIEDDKKLTGLRIEKDLLERELRK